MYVISETIFNVSMVAVSPTLDGIQGGPVSHDVSSRMILILSIQKLASSLASISDESCMGSDLHLLLLNKLLIRENNFFIISS